MLSIFSHINAWLLDRKWRRIEAQIAADFGSEEAQKAISAMKYLYTMAGIDIRTIKYERSDEHK